MKIIFIVHCKKNTDFVKYLVSKGGNNNSKYIDGITRYEDSHFECNFLHLLINCGKCLRYQKSYVGLILFQFLLCKSCCCFLRFYLFFLEIIKTIIFRLCSVNETTCTNILLHVHFTTFSLFMQSTVYIFAFLLSQSLDIVGNSYFSPPIL